MPTQIRLPFGVDATGAIATVSDPKEIDRQNLIGLIGTAPGERVMRPRYGVPLRDLLFDLDDGVLSSQIKVGIENAVAEYAPEVSLVGVSFDTVGDDGRVQVEIDYRPALGRLDTGTQTAVTAVSA